MCWYRVTFHNCRPCRKILTEYRLDRCVSGAQSLDVDLLSVVARAGQDAGTNGLEDMKVAKLDHRLGERGPVCADLPHILVGQAKSRVHGRVRGASWLVREWCGGKCVGKLAEKMRDGVHAVVGANLPGCEQHVRQRIRALMGHSHKSQQLETVDFDLERAVHDQELGGCRRASLHQGFANLRSKRHVVALAVAVLTNKKPPEVLATVLVVGQQGLDLRHGAESSKVATAPSLVKQGAETSGPDGHHFVVKQCVRESKDIRKRAMAVFHNQLLQLERNGGTGAMLMQLGVRVADANDAVVQHAVCQVGTITDPVDGGRVG